jgi:DNA-binding transcriptional MerR regulator/methylmalonyl-CoA mutase cobalamin-binding subunit
MSESQYPIQVAARLSGVSAHVIRIWEQRYRAVEPQRTHSNRRLYSPRDIERLSMLRDATRAGHSIGQVAALSSDKLAKLLGASSGVGPRPARMVVGVSAESGFLDDFIAAIQALDDQALQDSLQRSAVALGALGMLQRVVAPLTQTLGDLWRSGTLTAAHEHFATAALRIFLGNSARPFGATDQAAVLVVATPAGQVHELGALLVGAVAANLGWQITYLGASLPAAEIAGAAHQRQARAVALSLVYPEDDPGLEAELTRLRDSLPKETALLVGGRAMPAYRDVLARLGAVLVEDFTQLGLALDELRRPVGKAKR